MAVYRYKAKRGPGEIVAGEVFAHSEHEAVDQITALGLAPIHVEEIRRAADGGPHTEPQMPRSGIFSPGKMRFSRKELDSFTLQLASLVKANVPILKALSLLCQQAETPALQWVSRQIHSQIGEGKMLSQALGQYPYIFNHLYIHLIQVGEKGGVLAPALEQLAVYRRKEMEIRQKIGAALIYPVFLFFAGFSTMVIMLTCFLPKLLVLFENMRGQLPFQTIVVMRLSRFFSRYWLLLGAFGLFAGYLFRRWRQSAGNKVLLDEWALRLPFLKKFILSVEVGCFSRTLYLLVKSGIPVCDGLEIATEALGNEALKVRLRRAREQVLNQGSRLSSGLQETGVFPLFAVNMIMVGEEGGKLDQSLQEISYAYEQEVEQGLKVIMSLLEPLLILIIGGMIGFIMFAMLLPVFNIGLGIK